VGDVISGVGLGLFGRGYRAVGPNNYFAQGSILLKILVETRLNSESSEPLVGLSRVSGSKVRVKYRRIFFGNFYPNLVFFGHNF